MRESPYHATEALYPADIEREWLDPANRSLSSSYWTRFLALEPGHADAYLERAGTHRHAGNAEASRADLKKACDLGNQKACQILSGLR